MDRKSIILLVVCFLVLVLWQPLVMNKLYPPKRIAGGTNAPAATGTNVTTTNVPPSTLAEAPAKAAPAVQITNAPEELLEITNTEAHYTFSTRGGGLKVVELLHYPESVETKRSHASLTNRVATLNNPAPWPTLALPTPGRPARAEGPRQRTGYREGLQTELQLPGRSLRAAGKPFGGAADVAAAGMVCRHGHTHEPAGQWHCGGHDVV